MKRKKSLNKIEKRKVIKHLKGDMKNYKKESSEDKELMHDLNKSKKRGIKHRDPKPKSKGKAKIKVVMEEFKEGRLHSGSKHGPLVGNPKQAIAIAISESKRKKRK